MLKSKTEKNIVLISRMATLVGAFVSIVGAWNLFRDIQCEYWPTTKGVIQKTEIKQNSQGKSATYSPKISYCYQVEGRYYLSSLRGFGELKGSSNNWAQIILSHYRVGQTVLIHYDPDKPELAVLETGIQGGTLLYFIVGIILVLVGWKLPKLQSRFIIAKT